MLLDDKRATATIKAHTNDQRMHFEATGLGQCVPAAKATECHVRKVDRATHGC